MLFRRRQGRHTSEGALPLSELPPGALHRQIFLKKAEAALYRPKNRVPTNSIAGRRLFGRIGTGAEKPPCKRRAASSYEI